MKSFFRPIWVFVVQQSMWVALWWSFLGPFATAAVWVMVLLGFQTWQEALGWSSIFLSTALVTWTYLCWMAND